jgi:hypothetical protein
MAKIKKTTKGTTAVAVQKTLLQKGLRLEKGYSIVKRKTKKK